jgi:LPXTG-motif cell wall-anchored protein
VDGSCPQLCNSLPVKDAVYVQQPSRLWKCCGADGDGTPHCDQPTDENFDASRPEKLDTYYQAGVGVVASTSTKTRGEQSATSAASPPSGQVTVTASGLDPSATAPAATSAESSISTGEAGAIAGGAAAAILALSLIFVFLFRRRRPRTVREISGPIHLSSGYDFGAAARSETPVRGTTSYDGTERSESPFVHAITAPWPLGSADRKETSTVSHSAMELHTEQAWEMPADAIRIKTPQI